MLDYGSWTRKTRITGYQFVKLTGNIWPINEWILFLYLLVYRCVRVVHVPSTNNLQMLFYILSVIIVLIYFGTLVPVYEILLAIVLEVFWCYSESIWIVSSTFILFLDSQPFYQTLWISVFSFQNCSEFFCFELLFECQMKMEYLEHGFIFGIFTLYVTHIIGLTFMVSLLDAGLCSPGWFCRLNWVNCIIYNGKMATLNVNIILAQSTSIFYKIQAVSPTRMWCCTKSFACFVVCFSVFEFLFLLYICVILISYLFAFFSFVIKYDYIVCVIVVIIDIVWMSIWLCYLFGIVVFLMMINY